MDIKELFEKKAKLKLTAKSLLAFSATMELMVENGKVIITYRC
jgi:hypothetical protein